MNNARNLIDQLNKIDESVNIEAKKGSEVGKSIMETICAFANEPGLGGGYIILGLEAKRTLFEAEYIPIGVPDTDKIQQDIISKCRDSFNVLIRPSVVVEDVGGKAVVVVFVQEVSSAEKPVYFKKRGLPEGAIRRFGPSDHKCTEDDLVSLYAGRQIETFDSSEIPDASIEDIDPDAIQEYRNLRKQVNGDAEELSWPDKDLLYALGCTRKKGDVMKPTVAGILLFGKQIALRRYFPMMRVDYLRVSGKKWIENPDNRFETIEIRRPLIETVRRIQTAIIEDLPKAFSLPEGSIQSKQTPALPQRAIREAIVNAAMHRSYRIHGAIQIIRYANRLEIRNPGHSLKAEEKLGEPGSETRNPIIAAVFHDLNIAETKGSGIRVMRQLMHENNLIPPTFESTRQPDQFVTTLLFHHFLNKEDVEWLGEFGERFSDQEMRALIFVREVGVINNAAYREINQTDTLDASTHLRRLRDIQLLDKKGSGSKTFYLPGKRFKESIIEVQNTHRVENNTHRAGKDTHRVGVMDQAESDRLKSLLPKELQDKMPVAGTKPRKDKITGIILEICEFSEFSALELTAIMGRKDKKNLVREYLTPLVEEGKLQYCIPEMPDHPDQKYKTPSKGAEEAETF